jgi:RNA polymerase sigma factor (sigma-70 family)
MGAPLSLAGEPADRPREEGVATSFEDFFRDAHVSLFRALALVTGNRQEAEDVMQVAFMKVFERWNRVSEMENPEGFLYRVAMNEFRSRYRRAKRAIRRAVSSSSSEEAFEEAIEDRDVVIRALGQPVPPTARRDRADRPTRVLLGGGGRAPRDRRGDGSDARLAGACIDAKDGG